MSREKQIEEMAKCCIYHKDGMCVIDKDISYCDLMCKMLGFTTNLYNAGYRKQSEGEWIDQYNGKYANPIYVCSMCGKGTLLTPCMNELNNMEMTQALSLYCPNCGAKMKGGAE